MNSREVEAVFAIRKAYANKGVERKKWMTRAGELVGKQRASELADNVSAVMDEARRG